MGSFWTQLDLRRSKLAIPWLEWMTWVTMSPFLCRITSRYTPERLSEFFNDNFLLFPRSTQMGLELGVLWTWPSIWIGYADWCSQWPTLSSSCATFQNIRLEIKGSAFSNFPRNWSDKCAKLLLQSEALPYFSVKNCNSNYLVFVTTKCILKRGLNLFLNWSLI